MSCTLVIGLFALLSSSIFLCGFFLTRHELGVRTTGKKFVLQEETGAIKQNLQEDISLNSCKKHKNIFFFIIDALRYDFFVLRDEVGITNISHFPRLKNILYESPSNSHIFKFRGDPPTVTSQRLKALTTGSLPTFIEFGSNFNSSALLDDNIILQLRNSQRRMIFMGDDTWHALFPDSFQSSHPMDSFNTKDLYAVDDGIESLLWKKLEEPWDVFIAHFLGVDHIGHTHHAHHPLMNERLERMDFLAEEVIKKLPENSLFVLFGDHGMTDLGNHGGASEEETDSVLFVYSTSPLFPVFPSQPSPETITDPTPRDTAPLTAIDVEDTKAVCCSVGGNISGLSRVNAELREGCRDKLKAEWDPSEGIFQFKEIGYLANHPRTINQIDLVPTLSLLLGVPIPFSSLGIIVPELLLEQSTTNHKYKGLSWDISERELNYQLLDNGMVLRAHQLNANQVWEYLQAYNEHIDGGWEGREFENIKALFQYANESNIRFQQTCECLDNHCEVANMVDVCQKLLKNTLLAYNRFLHATQDFCRNKWTQFNVPLMILGGWGLFSLLLISLFLMRSWCLNLVHKEEEPQALTSTDTQQSISTSGNGVLGESGISELLKPYNITMCLLLVFHVVAPLSNSFIINEDWVHFFAIQSATWALLLEAYSLRRPRDIMICLAGLVSLLTIRISWSIRGYNQDVSASFSIYSTVIPMTSLITILIIVQKYIDRELFISGSFSSKGIISSLSICLFLIETTHILLYWTSTSQTDSFSRSTSDARNILHSERKSIFDTIEVIFHTCVHNILSITYKNSSKFICPYIVFGSSLMGILLSPMTSANRRTDNSKTTPQRVSRTSFHMLIHVVPLLVLLIGPNSCGQILCCLVHSLLSIYLLSKNFSETFDNSNSTEKLQSSHSPRKSIASIRLITWQMLIRSISITSHALSISRHLFYITGHKLDFGALQVASGFIGADKFIFNYAGTMLAMNTFGHIVFGQILLLFMISTLIAILSNSKSPFEDSENRVFYQKYRSFLTFIVTLSTIESVGISFGSVLAASILRRHLMVWAVFAPKVIFEIIFMTVLITCNSALLWYCM